MPSSRPQRVAGLRGVPVPAGHDASVRDFWSRSAAEVLEVAGSTPEGLSKDEAARRLAADGPNTLAAGSRVRGLRLLVAQFTSPIVLILIGATLLSLVLGDVADSLIILAIVLASGMLGFWQQHTADEAVEALLEQVQVTARVIRDGAEREIPAEEIVRGDIVLLVPGSVISGDCRVLESKGLLLDESVLTGESYAAHKEPEPVDRAVAPGKRRSGVFMGTHVVSGTGRAVVVYTARDSEFGSLAARLGTDEGVTSFEHGATDFGLLLVRAMTLLVSAVFIVNVVLHRPMIDSLLFSLALAVGLTPQLLPAIVAVSLAKGAKRMAAEKVIVKRLDAIEDLGAMTVLCTDKTGTITQGVIELDGALGLDGKPDGEVGRLAYLNATLQKGFPNPLDLAIARESPPEKGAELLDEVPYDFSRKRLSVLVSDERAPLLITKGAFSSMLEVCTHAEIAGRFVEIGSVRKTLEQQFDEQSRQGLRVLGLATRLLPGREHIAETDESDMVLRGLLTFADPPKETAHQAVKNLAKSGVSICVVTGDNRLAARHTAESVGLPSEDIVTAQEIDALTEDELVATVRSARVFAEVEPVHKERIVLALRHAGETVGFLGDGINDAAALHAADVGISVDTAVDVAKQAASVVLLDKSLQVVADGIDVGRQTFVNTLKYVRVTISANFGNVVSMAAASAFLPFLPLLPRQILLLNFLSDIPATAISTDSVDPEQTATPEQWDVRGIRRFMIVFGLLSSVFDILTFIVLRHGLGATDALFRSGWFIESTATELAALLVLRTGRRFYQSRPSGILLGLSILVLAITVALPFSPAAGVLGLSPVSPGLLAVLGVLVVVYVLANEVAKVWFERTGPWQGEAPVAVGGTPTTR